MWGPITESKVWCSLRGPDELEAQHAPLPYELLSMVILHCRSFPASDLGCAVVQRLGLCSRAAAWAAQPNANVNVDVNANVNINVNVQSGWSMHGHAIMARPRVAVVGVVVVGVVVVGVCV